MYNRGRYKNRVFFSHGDFSEGFEFVTIKKDLKSGEELLEDESGWFNFNKKTIDLFEKSIATGKFKNFELKDDKGKVYKFTKNEQQLLLEEYLDNRFNKIDGLSMRKKIKFIKDYFSLKELIKLTKNS